MTEHNKNKLTEKIEVRVTKEEKERVLRRSKNQKKSMSDIVRAGIARQEKKKKIDLSGNRINNTETE